MEELHRVDIYSALNKPNLMLGADRELIMMTGLISASLIFTGATIVTTIVGVVLFFICSLLLRLMAKSDPLMRQIFIRQNKYKNFTIRKAHHFQRIKMLALKEFRSKAKAFPDILNYASFIDEGILLNKDGSLTAGFYYRAGDISSMTIS